MAYMTKESKKEWIYVNGLLIHFAVQQNITQSYKSTILQQKLIKKETKLQQY